jgi:HD-GYP domain-containing protein (c-di-GMP phosphodiesterase class II)
MFSLPPLKLVVVIMNAGMALATQEGYAAKTPPLAARIMSLADVYDALVSKRVYTAAWSHEDACKEIISKSGTHFDPQVVQAFALEMSAFREIALQFQDPV